MHVNPKTSLTLVTYYEEYSDYKISSLMCTLQVYLLIQDKWNSFWLNGAILCIYGDGIQLSCWVEHELRDIL